MFYLSKNPEKISEGSCDTEDWSKDAENSDLHHRNKLYFKIHSNGKELFETVIIFHCFYYIFNPINTASAFKNILKM